MSGLFAIIFFLCCSWQFRTQEENNKNHQSTPQLASFFCHACLVLCTFTTRETAGCRCFRATSAVFTDGHHAGRFVGAVFGLFGAQRFKLYCFLLSKRHKQTQWKGLWVWIHCSKQAWCPISVTTPGDGSSFVSLKWYFCSFFENFFFIIIIILASSVSFGILVTCWEV